MNNKLLLVTSITLLYRESQTQTHGEGSVGLVKQVISGIKLSDVNLGVGNERDVLQNLLNTARYMCEVPRDHQYEQTEFLQRIKLDTGDDTELYQIIADGITADLSPEATTRVCLNMKRSLHNHFREEQFGNALNAASYKFKFQRNSIGDIGKFATETISQLEPFQTDVVTKDPAIISSVNMSNKEEVEGVFNSIQEATSGESILRSGFQGLNRALDGGFRRGEEWVFGALQHDYKTGHSLSVFMDIPLFNVPVLKDPKKIPCVVRISAEDPLEQNFQFMFQRLKGIEAMNEGKTYTQEEMNELLKTVSPVEMGDYVQSKLRANGYEVFFFHVNPSMWTYRDICNKVLELEADGYEVHVMQVDYLLKFPTTGCDGKSAGEDIRNMYERIANFMKAHNVLFITPHQLSTDAKMLTREGRQDFVKELLGKGYYAGCKQIDQVVDGELFQHIEIVNGISYLTVQRGKHRKIGVTPQKHLYYVLEFHPVFGLLPDVDRADTTRKKVGGGPIGSNDETPFWELEAA